MGVVIPFPRRAKAPTAGPKEATITDYLDAYEALRDSLARAREERRIKEWRDGVHERVNRAVEEFKRRHP